MLSEAKHPVNFAERGSGSFAEFTLSETNGLRMTARGGPFATPC